MISSIHNIKTQESSSNSTSTSNAPLIDECSNATLNNCDKNAKCVDLIHEFECQCNIGFIGNGSSCSLSDGM